MPDGNGKSDRARRDGLMGLVASLGALAVKWKMALVDPLVAMTSAERRHAAALEANPIYQELKDIVAFVVESED